MTRSRRPSVRSLVVALVAVGVLSACGGEDAKESTAPTSSAPPAPEMTLEEFGIDWPVADPMEFAPAPKMPKGFDEERFPQMVNTLRIWARGAFIDAQVVEAEDPVVALKEKIGYEVGNPLEKSFRKTLVPRVSAVNRFAENVEVLGPPVTTTAWKVDEKPGEATVTLQVRGVYRVRVDGGPERLVGMLRTNSITGRAAPWEWGLGYSYAWQVFGASSCALALEDHLVPDEDLAEAREGFEEFVTTIKPGKVGPPTIGELRGVDEKLVNRCKSESTDA